MKLLLLILTVSFLCACGKTVSSQNDSNLRKTPGVSAPTETPLIMTLVFANHSMTNVPEWNSVSVPSPRIFQVPQVLTNTSFNGSQYSHPPLSLKLNNLQVVCVYYWSASAKKYQASPSCFEEFEVFTGDFFSLENIPPAQTVTMDAEYYL